MKYDQEKARKKFLEIKAETKYHKRMSYIMSVRMGKLYSRNRRLEPDGWKLFK